MNTNATLLDARRNKRDEFYTQLVDIEKELRHYKGQFKNKTVYCNCDDPYESNFFKYFAANFNTLGLKRLLATSYAGSTVCGEQMSLDDIEGLDGQKPYKIDIRQVDDYDGDGAVGLSDIEWLLNNNANTAEPLSGNGDFKSEECVELLQESDIVVTNPPFSMFREYVQQLVKYDKKFLILGHQNAIKYSGIWPLLKEGLMWLGHDNGGTKWFRVPMDYDIKTESRKKIERGVKYISMGNIAWFTNLDLKKRHEDIILTEKYSHETYPKYDNFNAIEVSRVANIPEDYEGFMGVPITFMFKHNPDQFRLEEYLNSGDIDGTNTYARIIISNKRI